MKRCYKRTRSDNSECKLTFGEEHIGIEGLHTRGEMDWGAVKSFRENEKILLLYTAPALFVPIPKHVCTEEQVTELRSLLLRKVMPVTQ
jgi:hypothetical protein